MQATLRALGRTLRSFAGNRPLLLLLFSLVAAGFVYRGFLTFLSMHLADVGEMGPRASYLMSVVLVAGIVAQRFGGELVDRRSGERLYLLETIPWAPALVLLALSPGPAAAVAGALVFGFCWALTQPVANALTAEYARAGGPRPAVRHPVRRHLRYWLVRDHGRGVSSDPGGDPGSFPGSGGGGRPGRSVRCGPAGPS